MPCSPPISSIRRPSCGWSARRRPGRLRSTGRSAAGEAVRVMTGAPLPRWCRCGRHGRGQRVRGRRARAAVAPARRRRRRPRRRGGRSRRGPRVPGGCGCPAGRAGRARQHQRSPDPRRAGRPGGRAVDRRRAGDRRIAAAARTDPREQRHDAGPAARRGGLRRRQPRRRSGRRGGVGSRPARRRSHLRRRRDEWRREHGRLRRREGGAGEDRRHALDADRHQAGQAVRLRDPRRHAAVRTARQPGQLAGQLRAHWPARRCGG